MTNQNPIRNRQAKVITKAVSTEAPSQNVVKSLIFPLAVGFTMFFVGWNAKSTQVKQVHGTALEQAAKAYELEIETLAETQQRMERLGL